MVITDRPCCDLPLLVEVPLPIVLRCDECTVEWVVVDRSPNPVALAA